MPQDYPISRFYTVSYRPLDGNESNNALLCSLIKRFQRGGGRKISGSIKSIEDGAEVHVRYKIKKGCFHWQKTSGKKILQKSLCAEDGNFYLFSYNTYGMLASKAVYGTDLSWISTDYYRGCKGGFKTIVSLCRAHGGIAFKKYGGDGADCMESKLFACPVREDGAQRSFVNNMYGLPQVYAETDAGCFDFCPKNEKRLRTSAIAGIKELKLEWPHEKKAELDFKYINNAVPDGDTIENIHKIDDCENQGDIQGNAITVKQTHGPACGFDFKKILPLNEMLKKMDKLSVSQWSELLNSQFKVDFPKLEKAAENNSLKKEKAYISESVKRPDTVRSIKEWSSGDAEHRSKYSVAAKGMSGVIIHADELKAEEPPVEGLEESNLIPAKRIVVTSKESYLYFGELINGFRHGRGRTQMKNGCTAYEGNYCKDKRDGFGVYYYKSGKLCYVGGWKQNLRDGMGIAFGADDGSVFVGHWERDIPTGRGSAFDMEGNLLYTGDWEDGKRHGYGTEYSNGRILRTGQWQDGEFCSGYSYKKNGSAEK